MFSFLLYTIWSLKKWAQSQKHAENIFQGSSLINWLILCLLQIWCPKLTAKTVVAETKSSKKIAIKFRKLLEKSECFTNTTRILRFVAISFFYWFNKIISLKCNEKMRNWHTYLVSVLKYSTKEIINEIRKWKIHMPFQFHLFRESLDILQLILQSKTNYDY